MKCVQDSQSIPLYTLQECNRNLRRILLQTIVLTCNQTDATTFVSDSLSSKFRGFNTNFNGIEMPQIYPQVCNCEDQ